MFGTTDDAIAVAKYWRTEAQRLEAERDNFKDLWDRTRETAERMQTALDYAVKRAQNGTERGDTHDHPMSWRLALIAIEEHSLAALGRERRSENE